RRNAFGTKKSSLKSAFTLGHHDAERAIPNLFAGVSVDGENSSGDSRDDHQIPHALLGFDSRRSHWRRQSSKTIGAIIDRNLPLEFEPADSFRIQRRFLGGPPGAPRIMPEGQPVGANRGSPEPPPNQGACENPSSVFKYFHISNFR